MSTEVYKRNSNKLIKLLKNESQANSQVDLWEQYKEQINAAKPLDLSRHSFTFFPNHDVANILAGLVTGANHLINQYTRDFGSPRLVQILGKLYSQKLKRDIDPERSILVTVGAAEAIHVSILGNVDWDDEVIVITPAYHSCIPLIYSCGGKPRIYPLNYKPKNKKDSYGTSSDWCIDEKGLEKLFNLKTKMIVFSNPNYLTGKVYTNRELEHIARLCKIWNVLCLVDESLEWSIYNNSKHLRMASIMDMWYRTLTIGSAGKALFLTGWKIGWIYGRPELINNAQIVHQNTVYTGCTPLQEAISVALEKELQGQKYFSANDYLLRINCKQLTEGFLSCGLKPIIPDGGYYLPVDVSACSESKKCKDLHDWLVNELNILGEPLSNYTGEVTDEDNTSNWGSIVCFSFVNHADTMEQAIQKLDKFQQRLLRQKINRVVRETSEKKKVQAKKS